MTSVSLREHRTGRVRTVKMKHEIRRELLARALWRARARAQLACSSCRPYAATSRKSCAAILCESGTRPPLLSFTAGALRAE
eukprot:3783130-Pleurochrysis_carterae.AAC.2